MTVAELVALLGELPPEYDVVVRHEVQGELDEGQDDSPDYNQPGLELVSSARKVIIK